MISWIAQVKTRPNAALQDMACVRRERCQENSKKELEMRVKEGLYGLGHTAAGRGKAGRESVVMDLSGAASFHTED